MNPLKKIRIVVATLVFVAVTMLFLDFTGTIHGYFGWLAKIQFIPAILSINLIVIVGLIALTLIFGRLYCSVICPLGIFQDLASSFSKVNNKFRYSPAMSWLRYSILGLFAIAFVAGIGSVVALLEPYSAFGRIVSNIFAPIYQCGNNVLAHYSEQLGNYAFYPVEIWMKSIATIAIAAISFIVIFYLAFKNGRTYCNTICPVGTILGFLSRFSFLKIYIDESKCNGCQKCAKNCKSSCIDIKNHKIDYSRCVVCYNCIDKCKQGAISYTSCLGRKNIKTENAKKVDTSKRDMLAITATMLATSAVSAQEKLADGGLAIIEDKIAPKRANKLVPPGAQSIRNFAKNCTGCQLCVSVCPNQVLRPSTGLMNFMQPEMSYEIGFCRPECTKCSEVCPTGAISKMDIAEKSSTQIGHAVFIEKNCVVLTDEVSCGNCAAHCPVGAIRMVKAKDGKYGGRRIPVVDTERCIGCGACENLCPARPFSAIYVEGNLAHRTI